MSRYKLRVPSAGTFLYGDDGRAVVADDIHQARDELEAFEVHSYIGVCRVVYAADVENGECHEDAEPGDTTIDYHFDDGREPGSNECRVWEVGPPGFHWTMAPFYPPIALDEIPIGTVIQDPKDQSWVRIVKLATRHKEGWKVRVEPEQEGGGKQRTLTFLAGESVSISPAFNNWRPTMHYRLEIKGEVAEGPREEMEQLRDDAIKALQDEWRRNLPPERARAETL